MLPFPLTSFEEYLYRDSSPAYPMTIIFRLRFDGFLEPEAFRNALSTALLRHPLLRATVSCTRFGRLTWTDNPDWHPSIHWHAKGDKSGFPETPFMDLTKEPGIRTWALDRDSGHDVIFQIHHCCTDGKGVMVFIEDLLIAYTMEQDTSGSGLALKELDSSKLRKRGTPDLRGGKYLKAVLLPLAVMNNVRKFFSRSPARLTEKQLEAPEIPPQKQHHAPLFFAFSQEESKHLISVARLFSVTLNDLLLRDLFLTINAWREKKKTGNIEDWLRFSVPVNLRTSADENAPLANSISLVFLDRQKTDFTDKNLLLKSIHQQMISNRRFCRKYAYIFSVGVARFLPGGVDRLTRSNKCFATTCFSNMGRVLDRTTLPLSDGRIVAGNVILTAVDTVAPPLRHQMDASFSVLTYAERIQLVLNYNSHTLPEHDARELFEMYLREIRQTAQESPHPESGK